MKNARALGLFSIHELLFAAVALAAATAGLAVEPGEVDNLRFDSDKETLLWDAEPLADHYNLYRGYLADLAVDFYGTPMDGEVAATSYHDPGTPVVAGQAWFYLVTAANLDGEGILGYGEEPTPRANNHPWPGLAVAGRWDPPQSWPAVAIHSVLMRTGAVLTWQGGGNPTTSFRWDSSTGQFASASAGSNLFCAGHSVLPDGKVFVTGGNVPLFAGQRSTWIFDPATEAWTQGPNMNKPRYYPTNVATGDGTVLIFSGNDENSEINPRVERYNPATNSLQLVAGANHVMQLYPTMHLLPDGTIFHTGPEANTEIFDPVAKTWTFLAATNFGQRGSANSVMLPPGFQKFMIIGGIPGGDQPATATAEIIDLTDAVPSWRYTNPMLFPRVHPNTLILPDGKLLTAGGGYDDVTPVHSPEIFDPQTEQWTLAAMMKSLFRLYHSTTVLLPDGRAMWLGGTDPFSNATAEIFNPPYLFRGPRPAINSAPASVLYGQSFSIGTPDAADIQSVVLTRPSSTTHSLDMDQRYVPLAFTIQSNSLDATAPADPDEAPPGYYMLWILNGNDVPSTAEFLRLE